jgi:hypothetical protein
MDITSLFSGMMIGAGMGLAFCVAILYKHHREVIMDKASSARALKKSLEPRVLETEEVTA